MNVFTIIILVLEALLCIWAVIAVWRKLCRYLRRKRVSAIGSERVYKRQASPIQYWLLVSIYFVIIPLLVVHFIGEIRDILDQPATPATSTEKAPSTTGLNINQGLFWGLVALNIPTYIFIGKLMFFRNFKDAVNTVERSIEPEGLSACKGWNRYLDNKIADFNLVVFFLFCLLIVWMEYVIITEYIMK